MIKTESKNSYYSFGFRIDSYLPLPELPPIIERTDIIIETVNVTKMDLSAFWSSVASLNEYFAVNDNQVLIRVPDTAIFCISNGNSIVVSPFEGYNDDKIRLYILGTCMGVILLQKKILPLHGSAIAINGKAYAILGESGAGKSTLASILLEKGFHLLSDDLIPVTLNQNNVPMVSPSYPQQKMWQETIDHLGMSSSHFQPLFDRETKFAVPVSSRFCSHSLPLAGIFELVKTETTAAIEPIKGLVRFQMLLRHTFRNFLLEHLELQGWHFTTLSRFVNQIEMFQLQRSSSYFSAHELAAFLLNTIPKEEL
ncbi:aldolase [Paenibacillus sp. LHD-38]|uniref:aldolase n=1 Tax=Paenibacillus sp. LHD-38 TaxID=3072143 RepID=UPI00280F245C|nr:aldolase [Paenibacillus sp. LHD-38]MDQ8735961.1 aldolase [Paenibacillus sp. LHD-38]